MTAAYPTLTYSELHILTRQLALVYDVVRTVDAGLTRILTYDADGRHVASENHCYDVWNKCERCTNCISSMAFRDKSRLTKFEFIDNDIYHVTSQYIEVDGDPCLLEIVEKDSDLVLAGTFGKEAFVERISQYTDRVYIDSLTGVNNRRYFDEQISYLNMDTVAMLDIDFFKKINDQYGHICGDEVLQEVAKTIRANMRKEDCLVRYGGDEFFLAFSEIPADSFLERLEQIRLAIRNLIIMQYPLIELTVSIGGVIGNGSVKDMLPIADRALYSAKKTRNKTVIMQL